MARLQFSIGGVALADFEVPSTFTLGGTQAHAKHDVPGGVRDVQTYGAFPGPRNWSGTLLGAGAFDRSSQLDAFRLSGNAVRFVFGGYEADVVVVEYTPTVLHENEIDYEIALVVVEEISSPASQPSATPDGAMLSGMQRANDRFQNPTSLQFPGASLLSAFQQFAVNMDATFPWTNLTADIARLLIAQAESLEIQITSFSGKYKSGAATVDDMNALLDAEEALTGVRQARITLVNYFGVNTASAAYFAGVTVFDLASRFYGDASQGLAILQANGLSDPLIASPTPLTIPPGIVDATTPSGLFAPNVT